MSGYVEKKEEEKMWESIVQTKEYRREMEDSLPQELKIQAVVGASGFGAGKVGKRGLWDALLELTAWREEGGEIHQEEILLSTVADDRLLKHLQDTVKGDSLIKCSVRPSKNGSYLFLTGPIQKGEDAQLEAILKKQIQEVTMKVEGLGTFVLERTVDWFEKKMDWLGEKIHVSFDQDEEEVMESAIETIRTLMEDPKGWDQRIREYAADELLNLANDWAENADDDGSPIDREEFMKRMEMESIQAGEDGAFDFWFGDGDLFYGHSIHVTGDVTHGPDWVGIEG